MIVTGSTSIARQVRDVERAATSYEIHLRLRGASAAPPDAVALAAPASFTVREVVSGAGLGVPTPARGSGGARWLHADDAQPFTDPDGYAVTAHDRV